MPESRASARPMSAASAVVKSIATSIASGTGKLHVGEAERRAGDERALDERGRTEDRRHVGGDAGERDVCKRQDAGVAGEHLQTPGR